MKFNLDNRFIRELPADSIQENYVRQVNQAAYSFVMPTKVSDPSLIAFSKNLAASLGISETDIHSDLFKNLFSGNEILEGSQPYAMCYAGHQFGNWAGQLGDGRAINLFDIQINNQYYTLQLKGAGKTPYSRGADGLAVLRSSIREFLCSEAMYHLGVPTTRALSLVLTGDQVLRDVMYDGNPAMEKGAIVCRVSESFIRFGSFEIFAAKKDFENLKKLADYVIDRHFNELGRSPKDKYLALFQEVTNRTMHMIVEWLRVGFVHGVMNTDNMSILGQTIDYGPYGWLDNYDKGWTPNTTDRQTKRYRFGNQAAISLWNLVRLANALFPLIKDAEPLEKILSSYQFNLEKSYLQMMAHKMGLFSQNDGDEALISELEQLLELTETDMTIFFRNLSIIDAHTKAEEDMTWFDPMKFAFYKMDEVKGETWQSWKNWFIKYIERLNQESITNEQRVIQMKRVNPKYVLRNYIAQLVIDEADKGNYDVLCEVQNMLLNPYDEQEEYSKWFAKRPDWAKDKIGCSMLSCSS